MGIRTITPLGRRGEALVPAALLLFPALVWAQASGQRSVRSERMETFSVNTNEGNAAGAAGGAIPSGIRCPNERGTCFCPQNKQPKVRGEDHRHASKLRALEEQKAGFQVALRREHEPHAAATI